MLASVCAISCKLGSYYWYIYYTLLIYHMNIIIISSSSSSGIYLFSTTCITVLDFTVIVVPLFYAKCYGRTLVETSG